MAVGEYGSKVPNTSHTVDSKKHHDYTTLPFSLCGTFFQRKISPMDKVQVDLLMIRVHRGFYTCTPYFALVWTRHQWVDPDLYLLAGNISYSVLI